MCTRQKALDIQRRESSETLELMRIGVQDWEDSMYSGMMKVPRVQYRTMAEYFPWSLV